jgi:predicted RNA binding protein YcfA (HicA-like mRNA interferase family)
MPRRYRPREVARIAEHLGWELSHYRGDHAIFKKPGYSHISIPQYRRELAPGTLSGIIKLMGLTRREFDRMAEEVL